MLKHFIVTRLGLGVYSEAWFKKMLDLFEAVTLASLTGQTSRDFEWLIAVDAHMPPLARGQIEYLVKPHANYHLVPIDLTQLLHVRHGCFDWIWEICQAYVLDAGLIDDPCDYIVTSLIDADDAWHRDVVSIVNNFMRERLPAVCADESARPSAIRHTCGIAATFERGLKWFIAPDIVEPMHYPFLSMGVFVTARFSSGVSACSSRHGAWHTYAEVVAFQATAIESERPMWVYTRHDATMLPWDVRSNKAAPRAMDNEVAQSFGIDLAKSQRWRAAYPSLDVHEGRSVTAQFDRFFRIAALNRKIQSIQRRRALAKKDGRQSEHGLNAMLAQCEVQRELLIAAMRSSRPGDPQ